MTLYKPAVGNKIKTDIAGIATALTAVDSHIANVTDAHDIDVHIANTTTAHGMAVSALTSLTFQNGWTNQSGATYGVFRYYVDRNRVYVVGVLTGAAATANTCATLPVGARPATIRFFTPLVTAGTLDGTARILSTGAIELTSRGVVVVDFSFRINA